MAKDTCGINFETVKGLGAVSEAVTAIDLVEVVHAAVEAYAAAPATIAERGVAAYVKEHPAAAGAAAAFAVAAIAHVVYHGRRFLKR